MSSIIILTIRKVHPSLENATKFFKIIKLKNLTVTMLKYCAYYFMWILFSFLLQTMSLTATFFVVITASFLKPLLSINQSLQLPTVTIYDRYNEVPPFEASDADADGVTNFFLTLRLPQLLANTKDVDSDMKRQFDPWGGKRLSETLTKEGESSKKRQFSPWGGKRSFLKSLQDVDDDNLTAVDTQIKDSISAVKKRNLNSYGSKRNFNAWGGKRNFVDKDMKRGFNSWGGKRGFNSWGGKRNFNAWGGKRFVDELKEDVDTSSYMPNKNTNAGGKRQAFNSWGGKRSLNSWGGKRSFNSWGGKRTIDVEPEMKELNSSDEDLSLSTYNAVLENAVLEATEKSMR